MDHDVGYFDNLKQTLVNRNKRRLRAVSDFEQAKGIANIDPESVRWSFDYIVMDETVIEDGFVRQVVKFVAYSKDVWYKEEQIVYLSPRVINNLPRIMKEI